MITWLQVTFQKHNKIIFGSLLTVIILAFVLTIGNQSFFGSNTSREIQRKDFFGYNLANERDMNFIAQTGQLSIMLHPELRIRRDNADIYAHNRITALGLAAQMGIPSPSKTQQEAYIKELAMFQNEEGNFDAEKYNIFLNNVRNNNSTPEQLLVNVIKQDYQIQQVIEKLGGPGYILPYEAKINLQERETSRAVTLASVKFSDFKPEITATEEDYKNFYDENPARYQVGQQLDLTSVQFLTNRFLDQTSEPTQEIIEQYFEANKAKYQPTKQDDEAEVKEVTLVEVTDKVIADLKNAEAKEFAVQAANDFTISLWRNKIAKDSDEFNQLVKSSNATIIDIKPFEKSAPFYTTGIPYQLHNGIWDALTEERYFSDIGETPQGSMVLIYENIIPAVIPPYEEIVDKVKMTYDQEETKRLFIEKGIVLKEEITSGLNEKSIEELAAEKGLEIKSIASFKTMDMPRELYAYYDKLIKLDEGELSNMIVQGADGVFLYINEKNVPEITSNDTEVKEMIKANSEQQSQQTAWSILQELTVNTLAQYQ